MLRSNNQYQTPNEYYNIHQMAVAGDVLEDFIVIFRDMMNRVCKLKQTNKIYNLIKEKLKTYTISSMYIKQTVQKIF